MASIIKKLINKVKSTSVGHFFEDNFGFEAGIDLSNETEVLHRRNVVIKNIIFISNLLYSIIFFFISFGDSSNWVLTIILFPITFFVNHTLKKMIENNKDNLLKQQIAMYIACFYMFLSALLVYIKLKNQYNGENVVIYSEVGYMMLYYSMVVVSLYQDKKALATVSKWMFLLMTVLHFTVTYDIVHKPYSRNFTDFVQGFFSSEEFKDMALRTLVLVAFCAVLFIVVSMSEYLQSERKKELTKRKEVQDDFTKVVTDLFEVTISDLDINEHEISELKLLSELSAKFAGFMRIEPEQIAKIENFVMVYVDKRVELESINQIEDKDQQFETLRQQTTLGSIIVRRLELKRRVEDIIRANIEGTVNDEMVTKFRLKNYSTNEQIIMISDVYSTLRSVRSYKKPYSHSMTIEVMKGNFRKYFDYDIFDRFIKFEADFERVYNEFKEN